jgi:hypothetical protein
MSVRTTAAAVGGIIEVDANIDVTPFIATANAIVTECCTGGDHDAGRLELIERWLSAHYYAVRDPRAESEKAGSVGAKYQSKVDLGFNTSHYGQTAMQLDTEGNLAALNEKTKRGAVSVGVSWLGKTEDEMRITDEV